MPPNSNVNAGAAATESERYMKAEQKFSAGDLVWTDDLEEVWKSAEVIRQDNTILTVKFKSTGQTADIDMGFGETYPQNPKVVADMTAMHHIHEAGILYNLGERSALRDQKPYTFMGTILIAVNPLRFVKDPEMSVFMNRPLNPETPHPYAIAELAYNQMRLGKGKASANQSIVVSGESGAGKTETSKIILRFLTQRSAGGITGLEDKVVKSSPILESFGNAKTLRNNNSSRFGKFLKLQFSGEKYCLAGSFIETYLLEKSRVLSQGQGERNFHILYELVAGGALSDLATTLKLDGPESYSILSKNGCVTLPGVDDAEQFAAVQKAFGTIGLDAETQMQVWKILAAVLHLSKFELGKMDHEQGEVATVADEEALAHLAFLLGVTGDSLKSLLTQRVVKTRGEVFTKLYGMQEATRVRDAVVKALYQAMFRWVVMVINVSLGKGPESLPFIGVLDIFGFENFDHGNEYEQLLINYTNESLQDTFNKQVFNNELQLYEEEGIEVVVSSCPDNAECLLMLSAKPKGIIPSLDNVCSEPNPTDLRYTALIHKEYTRHPDFPATARKDVRENFWVKHYAGKVKYTVDGWVEKNMDRIPEAFVETLKSSQEKVVKECAQAFAPPTPAGASHGRSHKTLVRPTVAKAFLGSMASLNKTLLGTRCNFVRCIKPNKDMAVGVFSNRYVVDQLQCLGILQTCEVLKVGMPTRVTYTELKETLGERTVDAERLFKGEPETALIAAILWAYEVPSESFRLGRTRVFFRAGQISTLEKILNDNSAERGLWIIERLEQALANRHKAKAAAEEAQAAMGEAEKALGTAREAASKVLVVIDDEDDELIRSQKPSGPSEDDLHPLESAAKKARKASTTASQIRSLLTAAEEDEIGKYAKGVMERVLAASETTLETINASGAIADKLEAGIATARGGGEKAVLRRLEDALDRLKDQFTELGRMAQGAVEAAAKCQVEVTDEKTASTKAMAEDLVSGAVKVTADANSADEASRRKQEAYVKAKALAPEAQVAAEKALSAYNEFKEVIEAAGEEEEKAREAQLAKEAREAEERAKKVAEEAEALARKRAMEAEAEAANAEAAAAAEAAAKLAKEAAEAEEALQLEKRDTIEPLSGPSTAPSDRSKFLARGRSSSVKDVLATAHAPEDSLSPQRKPKQEDESEMYARDAPQMIPGGGQGARNFEALFTEAMESGTVEGHLMKQSKFFSRWKPRYFQLEDGFIRYWDKKSLVGARNNKTKQAMELTSQSITSYTNTKNCFCVRTGEMVWFLLAKDDLSMNKWMVSINAHIHGIFMKNYVKPEDNYWDQGLKGRFFYKMVDDALPQWIRTYPEVAAPRTGDGLFPGEVIEVDQVLSQNGVVFLRIANERGWTFAKHPEDNSVLFEKIEGEIVKDQRNYGFPTSAREPVPILFGPGLDSQQTGEALVPGEKAEAVERFAPDDGMGVVFIKLADGRGWVPVRKKNGSFRGVTASMHSLGGRSMQSPTTSGFSSFR